MKEETGKKPYEEDDPEVLVTVLTGAGTQAFSAGADLGNPKTHRVNSPGEHLATVSPRGFAVFNAVADFPKPVVVAINGFAVGIGCLITLCGDILLASDNAELGLPQVPLGIIPAYGGAVRLARYVGRGKAMEMVLLGERITAAEAYRVGLVNKVVPARKRSGYNVFAGGAVSGLAAAAPEPSVTEKTFDEFHLYTVANPTTLRHQETKQVEFIRAAGVKAERLYIYDGAMLDDWHSGMSAGEDSDYGTQSNKKVAVFREFKNSEANKLGIPLPKGKVRFYTQDAADASLQFVGENEVGHTPKDELVRLYMGNSFDLVGERKRTDFKVSKANHRAEETFEIKVRNRKKEPAEVRVTEHLYRWTNWEIAAKSQDFEKKDAQTIEFRVPLKPDEERTITYKVKYTW